MISTATLIDETAKKKKGTVILGSTVIVKDMEFGDEETCTVSRHY